MPLTPDLFDAWLEAESWPEFLRSAPEAALRKWIVSDRVNQMGHGDDDATLTEAEWEP